MSSDPDLRALHLIISNPRIAFAGSSLGLASQILGIIHRDRYPSSPVLFILRTTFGPRINPDVRALGSLLVLNVRNWNRRASCKNRETSLATSPWFKRPRPERLSQPIRHCQEPFQMSKLQRPEGSPAPSEQLIGPNSPSPSAILGLTRMALR